MSKNSDSNKIDSFLTYDDVLIQPGYSEILPADVQVASKFSRNIDLKIPIVSAAMDTVTEAATAICMAQNGAIGVIHKNMSGEIQAQEVSKVKKYESGMILNPITVSTNMSLADVVELTKQKKITGVPVVEGKKLVGILTSRDLAFETNLNQKVKDVMTGEDRLIVGEEGIQIEEAKKLLHKYRIEKLPIVDKSRNLKGLITIKDIKRSIDFPDS
ncbi:IMP dehydrogenase, partial [Bacteriovoracaceae bacterium]|nr:IMP dehydrogenase [Bacteriovoracaceae bacterium]